MGLLLGGPSWFQTTLSPLRFSIASSDPCSPSLLPPSRRQAATKARFVFAVRCTNEKSRVDTAGTSYRRALLLVSISVIPFLKLGATAEEALVLEGKSNRKKNFKARDKMKERSRGSAKSGFQIRPHARTVETGQNMDLVQPVGFRGRAKTIKRVYTDVDEASDKDDIIEAEKQNIAVSDKIELTVQDAQDVNMRNNKAAQPEANGLDDTVQEVSSQGSNQFEQAVLSNAPANSLVSFLNEFGIVASGVLGALYASCQKEKKDIESSGICINLLHSLSMKSKLTGKEVAISSLKENCETMLRREEEEKMNQMRKLKEDKDSLLNQLALANGTTTALRQEILSERKLVEEFKARIGDLENSVAKTDADKKIIETNLVEKIENFSVLQDKVNLLILEINDNEKNIGSLKSFISENELERKNLCSIIERLKEELLVANSTIGKLKEELHDAKAELSSNISSIHLNDKIQLLISEKESSVQKLQSLMKDYNDLKSTSGRKSALDAELLSKKGEQLQYLEEKIELALTEAMNNDALITELRKEKEDLKALLEFEENNLKILKEELEVAHDALGSSKVEVSGLSNELDEAKASYEKLMSDASELQDRFSEIEKLLTSSLEEAKSSSKLLSDELLSVKEELRIAKEDLDITSKEFKDVREDSKRLKKELVEACKKLEAAVNEVKQERKLVSTFNKELEVLWKQMQQDLKARKALQADLDEATKSLDEMNKSALLLSRELESSNSRTSTLEGENEMLFKSLTEQKNFAREARENAEDAQNLIMRLGSDRENLEMRSKKLEEELSSAKGEILRLRRQISMKHGSDNDKPKINEAVAGTSFTVKKTTSRRKNNESTRKVT